MKPMATSKAALLLFALWVSIIAAFGLVRWEMAYLTLPIITLFFVAVIFFKPSLDVEVVRTVPNERILEGDIVEIKLKLKAKERIPSLRIIEDIPNDLELVEGNREFVVSLRRGEEKELSYKVRIKRGIHKFGKVRIEYQDPFGFFFISKTIEHFNEIVGVPKLEEVVTPYSTKGTKVTVGPLPSPRVGEGVEFHAIREYQPGDPLKIINWKASAKMSKIMSNEYESERKIDVVLIVDATYKGKEVFDHLVRAAASFMLDALNNGTSFGLLISEEVPMWIRIDYGKRHFFKCIDFLSIAKPDKNNMIAYQVEHIIKTRFPARAQILYFSPLITEEGMEAVKLLYHYGYNVIVISPNPYSTIKPKTKEEELAKRILLLNRKVKLSKLAAYALIVDWDIHKPLKSAVSEVIKV
ncbi:MoxR associated protein [Palaeococcus pacificus DY20341]|uniref:MoxR associated protein n=1 Tax=Palaeococcus pacificus DY20341 TaxID=1343739 RepID=A0A075LVP6_9EURY|nr:DUF58 domain-containing protein [Palaeococcus pacificus]AIF68538.1 MoxR associated protein [Palaeococcus pacificus DY20341]